MSNEPGPFEPDPKINEILEVAESIGTEEALQAADEMVNNLDETPKEN
ncbi:hypothetical protein [Actinomadura sp. WMMA1423]|nr:hypothetical protein [Actinomadura sp. WMMA1423]